MEVSYVGALRDSRPCSSGFLEVSDERVAVVGGRLLDEFGTSVPGEFALPMIRSWPRPVEGPEQVERRVTATRLFLVGIFAFRWKKTQKVSFLVVETKDGMALFECRSLTPLELRARLAPWLARLKELPSADSPRTRTIRPNASAESSLSATKVFSPTTSIKQSVPR